MKLSQALNEYLLEIEIRKYTAKTVRSYRNNLTLFVRYLEEEAAIFDTEDLTLASVRRFSLYMSTKGKKGTYINSLLKTAKSFIQYCYDEGYADQSQEGIEKSHRLIIKRWDLLLGWDHHRITKEAQSS